MPAKSEGGARTRALAAAAGLYFSLVFGVGLVLGPVRVLWIEPRLGAALAVVVEAPFLLIAMVVAAALAPRWARVAGDWRSYLAIGVIALLLQQIADLAVGFGLRGMTLTGLFTYFATPAGWAYGAALICFALMPLVVHSRSQHGEVGVARR
jgi:hypothetical protein